MTKNISAFKELNKLWKALTADTKDGPIDLKIDIQKSLSSLFQLGDYYYYVIDLVNAKMMFIGNEIETLLGYKPALFTMEFYMNKVHPEDLPYLLTFEKTNNRFFKELSPNKILKYKVRYDFRVKKSDGTYIRVLHQAIALKQDKKGVILASLSIDKDITHLKKEGTPVLSFIGLDGEPSFVDIDVEQQFAKSKDILTKREKQVLSLIIEGLASKEISALLKISNQTVETHRKNMIKKVGAKNSGELIAQALKKGWV